MKRYILFLTFLIFVAASCNNIKEGAIIEGKATSIDLDSGRKTISFVDAVNIERVINLETNEKSLISESVSIGKVIRLEGRYFILDNKFMAIKVFDSTGRFLYDVGAPGLGKGQFLNVQDMIFDSLHHSLLVLCNSPSKVSEFSPDGTWLNDSKLDFFACRMVIQPDGKRLFYVNQNKSDISQKKNILLTDEKNKVISRYLDFPKKLNASIKFSGGLYSAGNETYFNSPFSNIYYRLSGDTATPAFVVNYGKRTIPEDSIGLTAMMNAKLYNYQFTTFCKAGDFIGFNYMNKRLSVAFFNPRDGKLITNDIKADSLNTMFYNLVYQCDDKLIMILNANGMADFFKRNSDLIRQKLPVIYDQLVFAKHQNPSLMIFKLKDI